MSSLDPTVLHHLSLYLGSRLPFDVHHFRAPTGEPFTAPGYQKDPVPLTTESPQVSLSRLHRFEIVTASFSARHCRRLATVSGKAQGVVCVTHL